MDAGIHQIIDIILSSFVHRIARSDNLILFHINKRIHFYQTRTVLQRHKIRRALGNIQQNRESGRILFLLYRSLRRFHGRILFRPGHHIISSFFGTHIDQYKAYVRLIAGYRSHTGVQIHIITDCNIIISFCRPQYAFLPKNRIEKAGTIFSVISQLIDQHIRRIYRINPGRNIFHFIIGAFTGLCVQQHGSADICTAPEPDFVINNRSNPIRRSVFINFKGDGFKNFSRITKAKIPV